MTFRTIYTPEWIHSLLRRKVFFHLPVNSLNVVHSHICNTNKQKWFRCRLLSVGSAEYINTPTRLYWRLRFEPLLNAQLEICSKVFQALRYFPGLWTFVWRSNSASIDTVTLLSAGFPRKTLGSGSDHVSAVRQIHPNGHPDAHSRFQAFQ